MTTEAPDLTALKAEATAWFSTLRDRSARTRDLEDEAAGPFPPETTRRPVRPHALDRHRHSGARAGGGTMAMLRGRVFEKAASTSRRCTASSPPSSAASSGAAEDPRFYATGISLIAIRGTARPDVHMTPGSS